MRDVKNIINLNILKCYKILFKKESLMSNIGSYVIISIANCFLFSSFLFCLKGYSSLVNNINYILNFNNSKNGINQVKTDVNVRHSKRKKSKRKLRNKGKRSKTMANKKINKKLGENKNAPPKPIKIPKKKNINKNKKNLFRSKSLHESFKSISKIELNKNEINFKNNQIKLLNNRQNINKKNTPIFLNDYELNTLLYEEALLYDKRSYFQYYWSLLKTKHILLFAIIPSNDYNSPIIKFCLFLFSFAQYYAVNALFFTEKIFHLIKEEGGAYIFIYQLPQIIYSSLISSIIDIIIRTFSLTEKNIIQLKKDKIKNGKMNYKEALNCILLKFILFFIISFLFLAFFWYYLASFGAVYKNTQLYLLKDTLISFGLAMIYPFGLYLIPGIFRMASLKSSEKNKMCIYKFSKMIQFL